MSAEQIWDSLLTLVINETDVRRTNPQYEADTSIQYENLINMQPQKILQHAIKTVEKRQGNRGEAQKKKKTFKAKQNEFKKRLKAAQNANNAAATRKLLAQQAKFMAKYRKSQPEFARASELPSPAPAKHFLREFGQSDREVIDNGNLEPSIPQVLSMMNGILEKNVCRDPASVLMQQAVKAGSSKECVETVFLTMLSRKPSRKELQAWRPDFDAAVNQRRQSAMVDTFSDLIWTIANSNEFIFQK